MKSTDTSSTKQGRYGKLSSTVTPNGGAGIRGREIMDRLISRDLGNRIINESIITDSPFLFNRLIQPWSKIHKVNIHKFAYTYPISDNNPWAPTPPASASLTTGLRLFGRKGWCMEALAYPRAGDDIDGPMEKEGTSQDGAVAAKPEIGAGQLTTEEAERLAAIRAALSARKVTAKVIGREVSEDDESDYDGSSASSDSEIRDPTYVPSTTPSLSSSISSLHSKPPSASIETQYSRLLNAIANVMSTSFGVAARQNSPHPSSDRRRFCSVFATLPIPDDGFKRKPDGILIEGNTTPSRITWRKVIAVLEYTEQDFTLSASIVRQMHMKSYLILRRQPWRTFVLGISFAKKELRLHYYDRTGTIISLPIDIHKSPTKLIDVAATLAYGGRTGLGYDPTIYINEDLLDRQQLANPSPPTARSTLAMDQDPLPEPRQNAQTVIGWVIIPGGGKLDILGIVWTSDGMVGRGTTCYHVRDPATLQEFALKDYWVDAASIHHETEILDMLKNIPGVPKVAHSWTVGEEEDATGNTEENKSAQNTLDVRSNYEPVLPEQTLLAIGNCRVHRRILMTPFASPIYTFSSLEELVWSFVTIADTHEQMTDAGVLHQDISVNNLMIAPEMISPPPVAPSSSLPVSIPESTPVSAISGKLGTPVPPEQDQSRRGWIVDLDYAKLLNTSTTTSVGTGTLPFLSCHIIHIIDANSLNLNARKAIEQNAEDDLESLFYVLVWICCLYEGPNNSPRQDRPFRHTICYNWAERAIEQDFVVSRLAKSDFINDPGDDILLKDLHPYFKPIFGLLLKWRRMIREAYANQTQVSCGEVRRLLHDAYDQLCGKGTVEISDTDTSNIRRAKRPRVEELMT